MTDSILVVSGLHAYYDKSHILNGVNLSVGSGEIVSLLGRNGVGRSTMIKAIMGQVIRSGSIQFKGEAIESLPTYQISRRGLGMFQRIEKSSLI